MRLRPTSLTTANWLVLAALTGAVAAALGAFAATDAGVPLGGALSVALLAGMLLGGLVLSTGLVYRKLTNDGRVAEERQRQLTAWVNVRPLLGPLPVRMGGWAMDPMFAEQIVLAILQHRPRCVLECGSGSSTVLIAACLAHLGEGHLFSLDHDSGYADETRRQLRTRGHDAVATVITAPLTRTEVDGRVFQWYDVDPTAIPAPVDLVVVDGPPGDLSPHARYPLVPRLQARLAPHCVVLMDDGDRPDETWIAQRWAELLHSHPEHLSGGKGGWLLRRGVAATTR
jgi:predicted O-methyltransferase YrrM